MVFSRQVWHGLMFSCAASRSYASSRYVVSGESTGAMNDEEDDGYAADAAGCDEDGAKRTGPRSASISRRHERANAAANAARETRLSALFRDLNRRADISREMAGRGRPAGKFLQSRARSSETTSRGGGRGGAEATAFSRKRGQSLSSRNSQFEDDADASGNSDSSTVAVRKIVGQLVSPVPIAAALQESQAPGATRASKKNPIRRSCLASSCPDPPAVKIGLQISSGVVDEGSSLAGQQSAAEEQSLVNISEQQEAAQAESGKRVDEAAAEASSSSSGQSTTEVSSSEGIKPSSSDSALLRALDGSSDFTHAHFSEVFADAHPGSPTFVLHGLNCMIFEDGSRGSASAQEEKDQPAVELEGEDRAAEASNLLRRRGGGRADVVEVESSTSEQDEERFRDGLDFFARLVWKVLLVLYNSSPNLRLCVCCSRRCSRRSSKTCCRAVRKRWGEDVVCIAGDVGESVAGRESMEVPTTTIVPDWTVPPPTSIGWPSPTDRPPPTAPVKNQPQHPPLGSFAPLEALLVYDRADSGPHASGLSQFRIFSPDSREAVARHLSGQWRGPILGSSVCSDVSPSSSSSSALVAPRSWSFLLRRFTLDAPCRVFFKKFLYGLFKARVRFVVYENYLEISSTVHLQWCCGRRSKFVDQRLTCRVLTPEAGENEQMSTNADSELSPSPRSWTSAITGERASAGRPRDGGHDGLGGAAGATKRFSTLLGLFGLIESSSPEARASDGEDDLPRSVESIRASLRPFGWTVSATPCPHPFFGAGRLFWRFSSNNGIHCVTVHPRGIFRVGTFSPATLGAGTMINSDSTEANSIQGIAGGGDEDVFLAPYCVMRMQVFSRSSGRLLFDCRGCFERVADEV